jgi:hydroxyacyl-ACP dehydratase HTD2-like protein with hotdog domain
MADTVDLNTVDLNTVLAGWDPPPTTTEDPLDPAPSRALAAVLDQPPPTGVLPPLWHWMHFLSWPRTDALGPDGHPAGGEFLPPIPERTRMFVGGRLEIGAGLRLGTPARRRSALTDWTVKVGRTGTMLLVTVRHEIEQGGKVALVDEQDLMYRSGVAASRPAPAAAPSSTAPPAPPSSDAPWQESFAAGPVLLFRFSALTANSHRIHYDQPYATGVEGYPGLVVHGPLLAVLLAGLAGRHAPDRTVAAMRYRFARPVFAGDAVLLTGRPEAAGAELAVLAGDGQPSAQAHVTFG